MNADLNADPFVAAGLGVIGVALCWRGKWVERNNTVAFVVNHYNQIPLEERPETLSEVVAIKIDMKESALVPFTTGDHQEAAWKTAGIMSMGAAVGLIVKTIQGK